MIEFFSSWAKGVGLAIVIVSILEMVLPNNKTKKYVRMIMGTYVLFCMISPFIGSNFKLDEFTDIEKYVETGTTSQVDQTSMDERIKQLYIQELEKDITKKVESQGYKVNKCKVEASITDNVESTKINKITIQVEKDETKKTQKENNNSELEKKIVSEVQKIKEIDTTVVTQNDSKSTKSNLTQNDIKTIKKILKEEYEVNEQCLMIS